MKHRFVLRVILVACGIVLPALLDAASVQIKPETSACTFDLASVPSPPTGAVDFVVTPPAAGVTLQANAYGMLPSNPDNTAAFQAAINAAKAAGAARLVIPTGVYYFNSTTQVQFNGVRDMEIDGQGSELIFKNLGYFNIYIADRLWIHDLSVDWDWSVKPLANYVVLSGKSGTNSVNLDFPQLTTIATTEIPTTATNANFEPIDPVPGSYTPLIGGRESWENLANVRKLGPANQLTVDNAYLYSMPIGTAFRLRNYTYNRPAFPMYNAHHVKFQRVNLWGVPGMGFVINGDSHHIHWDTVNLKPRPGSGRNISVCADGFHVAQSLGNLKLENSEITMQGDDGVNFKDPAAYGLTVVNSNTLTLLNVPSWRFPLAAGDVLEFRNPDYTFEATAPPITSVTLSGSNATVVFSGTLPPLNVKSFAWNKRFNTNNYIIRNNFFHNHHGRGILAKAPNGTIEGNTFSDSTGESVQMSLGFWGSSTADPEGTYLNNLVIRNNTFTRSNRAAWGRKAIITGSVNLSAASPGPYWKAFQNVLIQGNTFNDFANYPINLSYFNGVIIGGNTMVYGPALTGTSNQTNWGAIQVANADNVQFCCNLWSGAFPAADQGLYYDSATCTNVTSCVVVSGSPTNTATPAGTVTSTRTSSPTSTPTPVVSCSALLVDDLEDSDYNTLLGGVWDSYPAAVTKTISTGNNGLGVGIQATGTNAADWPFLGATFNETDLGTKATIEFDFFSQDAATTFHIYVESTYTSAIFTATNSWTRMGASIGSGSGWRHVSVPVSSLAPNGSLGSYTAQQFLSKAVRINFTAAAPASGAFTLRVDNLNFACAGTPTMTPTGTRTSTASPTAQLPSATPTATVTPSATRTATTSSTSTATLTASPTRTSTATPSVTPSSSRTGTPSQTVVLPSATMSNTPLPGSTFTSTSSPTPTFSASPTSSRTLTSSPTNSRTSTYTQTAVVPSSTSTVTASQTVVLPSSTSTETPLPGSSFTDTPTVSPSFSATATVTDTAIAPSETSTWTATVTAILPSLTQTPSMSPVSTGTRTSTVTPSATATPSNTRSATPSPTSSATPGLTFSATRTIPPASTAALTATPTLTATLGVGPLAQPGEGSVSVAPTSLVSGSVGQSLLFVYTAQNAWSNGTLTLQIPASWPLPSLVATDQGAVTVSSSGSIGSLSVVGHTIVVSMNSLPAGGTFSISYGDRSSGPGLSVPTNVGFHAFNVKTQPDSGVGPAADLAVQPQVELKLPAALPTATAVQGPNEIENSVSVPSPWTGSGPLFVSAKLLGACDRLTLKVYSSSLVCVGTTELGAQPGGWAKIPAPTEFLNQAANGHYFYIVTAERGGQKNLKKAVGKISVLR